jgi:hypothetical protein
VGSGAGRCTLKYIRHALAGAATPSYNARLPGAGWSSLAARRAHNPKVAGSNPAPATNRFNEAWVTRPQELRGIESDTPVELPTFCED